MKTGDLFTEKKYWTVAVLYFLFCAVMLFTGGFHVDGEAEKIIDNANRLVNGEAFFNGGFGYFYLVNTLLVALFLKLSVNLIVIGLIQIILSFIAATCLYKLIIKFSGNTKWAFIFFIFYLVCYPIQKWNFFLYTESVHTSLLVIGIYYVNQWLTESENKKPAILGIVLLLIALSRPVGILFLMAVFIAVLFWMYQKKKRLAFYLLIGAGLMAIIVVLNSPFTAFVNPDSIRRMEVICQVPETTDRLPYQEYNREGLYQAFSVIKNEIGVVNFFKTGLKKLGYFFGMYRSYYSWPHNLLLICFTIFYPFALIGIFSKPGKSFYYIRLVAISYLLFTSMGIFFTCDEWSNRFISPAFVFILILAAGGVLVLYNRIYNRPTAA